jgi:diadenosine tetraphosphate (Ap4A) HIT family hydrolase
MVRIVTSAGSAWNDPARWEELKRPDACPICTRGVPLDVIADLAATWVTAGARAPLPGYACVVSKRHAVEPFHLPVAELTAFWNEAMAVARILCDLFEPTKMNYEIHGNTIPHLHMHLFPRFAGDPYAGGPIDPRCSSFTRSPGDLERLQKAVAATLRADGQ